MYVPCKTHKNIVSSITLFHLDHTTCSTTRYHLHLCQTPHFYKNQSTFCKSVRAGEDARNDFLGLQGHSPSEHCMMCNEFCYIALEVVL